MRGRSICKPHGLHYYLQGVVHFQTAFFKNFIQAFACKFSIAYIQINNKTQIITPTQKGEKIFDIVYASMPDMLNPKLTASWEKGLDMVAKKEIQPNIFMDKLEKYIHSKIDKLVVKM